MAAPTLGQHAASATIVSNAITLSPTGLTDGSTLVIGISQTANNVSQTYSVSDGVNSWSSAVGPIYTTVGAQPGRGAQIFYAPNIVTSGGALTVTVTRSGTSNFRAQYVELLGAHLSSPLDTTSSDAEITTNTSHVFSTAGITTSSNVFVYCVSAANSTLGTITPTASPAFTTLGGDWVDTSSYSQYYTNSTGLSANTLAWSSSSGRECANVVAAFIGAAAGGGSDGTKTNGLLLKGIG